MPVKNKGKKYKEKKAGKKAGICLLNLEFKGEKGKKDRCGYRVLSLIGLEPANLKNNSLWSPSARDTRRNRSARSGGFFPFLKGNLSVVAPGTYRLKPREG